MSKELSDERLEELQLKLTNAKRKVFCMVDNEGSSRRVRVLIAPEAGVVEDITDFLSGRTDKHNRLIVTGHGFSAAQDVAQKLERLSHMSLEYTASKGW